MKVSGNVGTCTEIYSQPFNTNLLALNISSIGLSMGSRVGENL